MLVKVTNGEEVERDEMRCYGWDGVELKRDGMALLNDRRKLGGMRRDGLSWDASFPLVRHCLL